MAAFARFAPEFVDVLGAYAIIRFYAQHVTIKPVEMWEEAVRLAMEDSFVSVDGIPWEIHKIEDVVARSAALTAWRDEHERLDP